MNIYLVERTDDTRYDEHDSFVCYAESEEVARYTKPNKDISTWTEWAENIKVTYLGTCTASTSHYEAGVILTSFNAG